MPTSPPRLAVVTRSLGIPSEVWMERQALALDGFATTLLGWERHPEAAPPPPGLATAAIEGPFPAPRGLLARGLRKAGRAGAYRISGAERAAIVRALDRARPDIVLAQFGWSAIPLAQALPPDLPLVIHVHGRDASALMAEPAYRAALKQALARAQGLVAVGAHQLERLAPLGLPPRVEVIPCGAPLALFAAGPLPAQPPATAATPVRFVSVGRLSEEKGMRESLEAFARILPDCPEAELVLIGFGPLFDPLSAEIRARGLQGRVRLTGRLAPKAIAAELAQAHVYLQHSRRHRGWVEGFGVTLTEAGAAGLPLLASASGGLVDQMVEGENGHLFAEGDVAGQAARMLALARDPAARARMGARARALAARFDSAAMAARLEAMLRELADSARTGPVSQA
ncbi:glycosyltransferase [Frigidibacter sp. MR17.14]|uniref:glycosyltransferase n=1 Tax=Frigidibacter sp. MR17.14 TaxID=3126509 RepID=UPI003012AE8D